MATNSLIEPSLALPRDERATVTLDTPEVADGYLVRIRPLELHSKLLSISAERFVIGRNADSQLPIADASISRYHAVIERSPLGYEITDLHSTNGLFVNERAVTNTLLVNGDFIRIGNYVYKFLSAEHVEAERQDNSDAAKSRDGLTGLPRKRYFAAAIEREIEHIQETQIPLSIACLDIDHLSIVNEHLGRMAGDEVLAEFAERVTCAIPGDAFLARIGGDEFGILLYECGQTSALAICERIREVVSARRFSTSKSTIAVSVSIGLATMLGNATDASTLAATADTLLITSKQTGRNRTTFKKFTNAFAFTENET